MARPAEVDPYELWKQQGRPGGAFRAPQGVDPLQGALQPLQAAPMATPQAGGAPNTQAYLSEVRGLGQNKSEDYQRFSDAELMAWQKYYIGNGKYRNIYGDIVDKPDERGANTPLNRNGTGDQGDFGYGWNATGIGGRTHGGINGAGTGAVAAPPLQAIAGPVASQDPLQGMMAGIQQAQPQAPFGAVPTVGQGNLQNMQSALQGMLTQQQAPQSAGMGVPKQLGTGWQVGTDGLSQMMQKQQRTIQPTRGPVAGQAAQRWF